jgi:hypothetical protein
MKTNLALVLALAALSASVAAALRAGRGGAAAPLPHDAGVRSPAPLHLEGGDCTGPEDVKSLKTHMRRRMNPALTRVSYTLYHATGEDDARRAALATDAATLAGCVMRATSYAPDLSLDGLPDYYRLLGALQSDTHALQVAAEEGDRDGAIHWLVHVKHDCEVCHAHYDVGAP